METKSAGEYFLLIVVFNLHVFNTGDLYNMQTRLFCNMFNQNILCQRAVTHLARRKT